MTYIIVAVGDFAFKETTISKRYARTSWFERSHQHRISRCPDVASWRITHEEIFDVQFMAHLYFADVFVPTSCPVCNYNFHKSPQTRNFPARHLQDSSRSRKRQTINKISSSPSPFSISLFSTSCEDIACTCINTLKVSTDDLYFDRLSNYLSFSFTKIRYRVISDVKWCFNHREREGYWKIQL